MGANRYYVEQSGRTIKEAFATAQQDAEDEYGHQEGYSGQINMACGVTDITDKYLKSELDLREFVEREYSKTSKHNPALAICVQKPMPNTNVVKSQVVHKVFKGTRKWVLWYAAYADGIENKFLGKKLKKADAVVIARKYSEKTTNCAKVVLERHLEGSEKTVAEINYKPSSKECGGRWIFFGYASD